MNIDFPSIKTKAISGLNSIGSTAYNIKDRAFSVAFQAKNRITSSDVFTKMNDGLKSHGIEKKTLVGAAVLVCTLALAGKTIKGVINKVKEIKTK